MEDAGLGAREVTPFMRVRVVGLTSKGSSKKVRPKEGLVTIWNPTEKQVKLLFVYLLVLSDLWKSSLL